MKSISKSLPRICVALGMSSPEALAHAAELEVKDGNTFLEFRLDYLPSPDLGIAAMRKFLARHPDCMILATCRRHQNQGRFNGSVE